VASGNYVAGGLSTVGQRPSTSPVSITTSTAGEIVHERSSSYLSLSEIPGRVNRWHQQSDAGLQPRFITAELTMADVNPAMIDLKPLATPRPSHALAQIDSLWAAEGGRRVAVRRPGRPRAAAAAPR
jgi:hypothetical protein